MKHVAVSMTISLPRKEQPAESVLINAIGNQSNYLKLPVWVNELLVSNYRTLQQQWASFLYNSLQNFCNTSLSSQIAWSAASIVGHYNFVHPEDITTERMLWIHACRSKEMNEDKKFIADLAETLHPWLNNQLYHQIKKKKENTRDNAAYKEQRLLLEQQAVMRG